MDSNEVGKELIKAAERGDTAKAVRCLRLTDIKTQQMSQALVLAAKGGHVEIVKILIKAGANLNLPDKTGWSPLHGATFSRHTEMVLMLVSAGAKINVVDKEGNTPLHCAARDGSHNVVRTLLDLGADKGARNNNEKMPIELAEDVTIVDQLTDPVVEEIEETFDNPKEGMYAMGLEDHRLNIVFSTLKQEYNGRIRNKHVLDVMQKLNIPYDKARLPKTFWDNHGEFYLRTMQELRDLIEKVRTDKDEKIDPLKELFRYELPQWLREEFKASEILLYEHHFSLIDVDNGGSIDVDELQALIVAFGSKISREDAQNVLNEYDMDGGGTIDFVEFMVLVYKIQRGTIDLSSSDLAQALTEAKSQLKIFEEIEDISRDLPAHCTVSHFGGSPVSCNFIILGPPGTPYEGCQLTLQMVFFDGYPYIQPDIQFVGRVMGLHVLPQLSGDGRLMHIKDIWTSEWSMRTLLEHTVDILTNPDPELLPDNLYSIYKSWENTYHRRMQELHPQIVQNVREAEEKARREKEQLARRSVQPSPRAESKDNDNTPHTTIGVDVKGMTINSQRATPLHSTHNSAAPSKHTTPRAEFKDTKDVKDIKDIKDTKSEETKPTSTPSSARGDLNTASPIPERSFEEKVAVETQRVSASLITMDDLSNADIRNKILALSRIERMHLPIMLLYLIDRNKYNETVLAFMKAQRPRAEHK